MKFMADNIGKETSANNIAKTMSADGVKIMAEKEIDFVVEGNNGTEYYQVAETVLGQATLMRELASLNAVKDHNPKFLLTMDYLPGSYNGIKQLNVIEWLLG